MKDYKQFLQPASIIIIPVHSVHKFSFGSRIHQSHLTKKCKYVKNLSIFKSDQTCSIILPFYPSLLGRSLM